MATYKALKSNDIGAPFGGTVSVDNIRTYPKTKK
jgi:hypothetical protein